MMRMLTNPSMGRGFAVPLYAQFLGLSTPFSLMHSSYQMQWPSSAADVDCNKRKNSLENYEMKSLKYFMDNQYYAVI